MQCDKGLVRPVARIKVQKEGDKIGWPSTEVEGQTHLGEFKVRKQQATHNIITCESMNPIETITHAPVYNWTGIIKQPRK